MAMKINFKLFFFMGMIMLLSSCGKQALYDEQFEIDQAKWPKDQSVYFKVNVPDTSTVYDFYLTIRHKADYRYSNIYFFLNTHFPNGNQTRDTLECILANEEGKWLGKGWGTIKEDDILLNKNMKFPVAGTYNFSFQQAMREDTLKGIVSIGLRIVPAK